MKLEQEAVLLMNKVLEPQHGWTITATQTLKRWRGELPATPESSPGATLSEALAETLNHPSADYFAATTRVIDEQFKLIDVAFNGLDQLLQNDARAARNQLAAVLGSLLLLGALALCTVCVITRSTTASIGAALHG